MNPYRRGSHTLFVTIEIAIKPTGLESASAMNTTAFLDRTHPRICLEKKRFAPGVFCKCNFHLGFSLNTIFR